MPRVIKGPWLTTLVTRLKSREDLATMATMVGSLFRSLRVQLLLKRISQTTKRSHHGLHPIAYRDVEECTDFKLGGTAVPTVSRHLVVKAPPDRIGGISPHKHQHICERFRVITVSKAGSFLLLGDPNDPRSFTTVELYPGQMFTASPGVIHGFHLLPGTRLVLSVEVEHFNAKDITIVSEEIPAIPTLDAQNQAA